MRFFTQLTSDTKSLMALAGLLLSLGVSATAVAEVPVINRDNPLLGVEGSYRLQHVQSTWTMLIKTKGAKKPLVIDLSDCAFYKRDVDESEDIDNGQVDGVFPLVIKQKAYVGVACHVGVHSHQLSLYAVDQATPVFKVTGAYYTALSVFPAGIAVDYDRRLSGHQMKQERKFFPDEPALFSQQALLSGQDKAASTARLSPVIANLRAGPVDDAPLLARLKQQDVHLHGEPTNTGWQFISDKDGVFGYVTRNTLQLRVEP